MTTKQPQPRTLQGHVTSDKMTKTVVVSVTRMKLHPKYKKFMKMTTKFKAHSPENAYHTGDKVIIQETKPMSKEKRWIVISKIS
jgi:small subunit ribosomal protein S17